MTGFRCGALRCLAWAAFAAAPAVCGEPRFVEVASASGIDFAHDSGLEGEMWTLEITGAGVGILDFDGDGRMDIYLVQGGPLRQRDARALPGDRLFRNVGASGELRFEDATAASGVRATGYGMGIAAADIDNDGDTDVFLANFGANQLLENVGQGRFVDATAKSGIVGEHWSIGASFADIDGDGLVDLYVANYLDFRIADHRPCHLYSSRQSYCAPSNYAGVADRLYRNLGNGRFEDASESAGIAAAARAGMGVVADDFDGDGKTDFYVANDAEENLLWLNKGGFRFVDGALLGGAAVNGYGIAEASMGVVAGDFDDDGDADLFMTHDVKESNTLFVNDGKGWFEDRSNALGIAADSMAHTGFGTGWFDADNDGDLDLFVANGAVRVVEPQRDAGILPPLRQANQLWLRDGAGRYRQVDGGPAFALESASRGAAFGDLDNDGDIDIVVANNHGQAHLLRNDSASANWLGLELDNGGTDATGAVVWLEPLDGEAPRRRRARTDGSYASARDPRIVFGLANRDTPRRVRVVWPDGTAQRFGPLAPGQYHVLRRTP